MASAKDLKNLAAQVRRTETALRNLAGFLPLSKDDQKPLLDAATVLAHHGRKLGIEAIQARRQEEARAKALGKAAPQARGMMADWPMANTLDKVALCLANQMEANLRQDLQADNKLAWSLQYWTEQARREIPDYAAHLAVRDGRPVIEVMATLQEKFEQFRARPTTIAFAQRWQSAMDAQERQLQPRPEAQTC